MLSRTPGIKSIDIIALSMGNWLAMETLRQLAIAGNRDLSGKLGYVVLASPDIDVDIFKKQMKRYGKPDKPFVVLLSADDQGAAFPRASSRASRPASATDANANELAALGVTVVDLSATESGDKLNHAKFADNPVLVQLLGERLRMPEGLAAEVETGQRSDQPARRQARSGHRNRHHHAAPDIPPSASSDRRKLAPQTKSSTFSNVLTSTSPTSDDPELGDDHQRQQRVLHVGVVQRAAAVAHRLGQLRRPWPRRSRRAR